MGYSNEEATFVNHIGLAFKFMFDVMSSSVVERGKMVGKVVPADKAILPNFIEVMRERC